MKKILIYHTLMAVIVIAFFLSASAQQTQYSDLIITEMEFGTAIEWNTINEKNTKTFVLEKSTDGVNFEAVETIDAIRNDNQKEGYYYVDLGLGSVDEKIQYRVKRIHKDESSSYGNMASVTKVYQNHFVVSSLDMTESSNEGVLYFSSMVEGDLQMDIVSREDASIIHTEFYAASVGFNKLELDFNAIAAGKYELIFTLDNETDSVALIKSKDALQEDLMSKLGSKKSKN